MSDFYGYADDWTDANKAIARESAQENNPGREIASEEVICPVPGVDDETVALFRITFVPEEEPV